MPTIQVSADDLLAAAAQLNPQELERFVEQVLLIRARKTAPALSAEESELLLKINQPLPVHIKQRFDELEAKRQQETLTREEQQDLLAVIRQIEALEVERAQHLAELARLRGVTLTTLLDQLGIHPPVGG